MEISTEKKRALLGVLQSAAALVYARKVHQAAIEQLEMAMVQLEVAVERVKEAS